MSWLLQILIVVTFLTEEAFKKFTFYDRTYIFTLFIMVIVLFTENQKSYSMYFRA